MLNSSWKAVDSVTVSDYLSNITECKTNDQILYPEVMTFCLNNQSNLTHTFVGVQSDSW